ncbi:MAG: peptidoglycan editing factor PgeF [Acidobacteria bacterium]|nr:MAG: peptidoglycan editing factor PgeF [Acidobacteriota bacterium]
MLPKPNGGFAWVQATAGPALVCRALEPYAAHLFTTRPWALGAPTDGNRTAAWDEVARALGVDGAHLWRAHQVHGASVVVRRLGDAERPGEPDESFPDADIIVSDDPAFALGIQAADCVPLLIADRRTNAVAAAHAGWKGMAAGVPLVTVDALCRHLGSQPADLVAAVGPSVGACCYEVGADVLDAFRRGGFDGAARQGWFFTVPQPSAKNASMTGLPRTPRPDHWFFDGWAAARRQLEAAGIPPDQIHVAGLCTASHQETLCSYRRDGRRAGRIAGAIRCAPRRA